MKANQHFFKKLKFYQYFSQSPVVVIYVGEDTERIDKFLIEVILDCKIYMYKMLEFLK